MQNYDYSRLHSSLVGVIQEAQAKIGYDRHVGRPYARNERGCGCG